MFESEKKNMRNSSFYISLILDQTSTKLHTFATLAMVNLFLNAFCNWTCRQLYYWIKLSPINYKMWWISSKRQKTIERVKTKTGALRLARALRLFHDYVFPRLPPVAWPKHVFPRLARKVCFWVPVGSLRHSRFLWLVRCSHLVLFSIQTSEKWENRFNLTLHPHP